MKTAAPTALDAPAGQLDQADLLAKKAAAIKYALELKRYTQADVARECKVSRTTVHMVIHGRGRSRKIELRIAAITRLPLADLWPQWHGDDAPRRRRPYSTARASVPLRAAAG